MQIPFKLVILICLVLFSTPQCVAADSIVQSVKMPAWLQRGGRSYPLTAGLQLQNNDQIFTGSDARVLLQTADGSAIKLGEYTAFTISNLTTGHEGLFSALLNVAKGAFRFTTALANKNRSRDVTVKIADATIGIRGTDVWGKDGEDHRLVVLIEGKISVTGADQRSFTMDQPLSVYGMPKGLAAQAVVPVDSAQLNKWAQETEIAPGSGNASVGGKWKVILLSTPTEAIALDAYDRWRNAGYAVQILPLDTVGGREYQLRISHLADKTGAASLAKSLAGQFGVVSPKVTR